MYKFWNFDFLGPNQDPTEPFLGESIPERHYLVGSSKIKHSRNGTRTILHKIAMLVVVWYAHLAWKLEFDRFLFQFKTVCTSFETFFFVQIKTFYWESIHERYFLVGSSKITRNRNGTRTISHKNAMLVVVWYSHKTWQFEFDRFLFQLKLLMYKSWNNDFFGPNQDPSIFWGVNTWKALSGGEL